MKKFKLLLFCIFLSFNSISQVKTNSNDTQIKTEQYECVFPKNFIFTSKDEKGYNVKKNFTVEAASLTYKANKLISFTLKSSSIAQVTYPVEKMISESSRVKQFWIDRSEKYFVVLSFPVDIDNGMRITFISNIDGSTIFDFGFQRILSEKERREQEILEVQQEKEQKDKKLKDVNQIKETLSQINIEEKVSQIKKEVEKYYKSLLKDKMKNISARDLLGLKDYKTTISLDGEFMLHIDKNKEIEIIKKVVNCAPTDYSFNISTDESNFINREALQQKDSCKNEYKIGDQTYYIFNNDIFTDDYKIDKNLSLEIKTIGVNFKNGKFKYYTNENIHFANENIIPKIVENWCSENIKTNGLYFINYILIDDELVCRTLNLDRQTKEYLKQRFKIGLLNKY